MMRLDRSRNSSRLHKSTTESLGSGPRDKKKRALGAGSRRRNAEQALAIKKAVERLDELGKRKGAGYKVVSLEQAAAFTGREPLVVEPRVPVRGRRRLKIAEAVAAVIEQRLAEENGDPEVVVENGSASEG